jgi:hypothetical protein
MQADAGVTPWRMAIPNKIAENLKKLFMYRHIGLKQEVVVKIINKGLFTQSLYYRINPLRSYAPAASTMNPVKRLP